MPTFKVFLAGLALDFTKEELFDFFQSQYDSVVSIQLVKQTHARTKTVNKGSGFMQLTDLAEVLDLLRREKFCLNGRNFLVKKFKEGAELEKFKKELESRRIFIHKIGPELDSEDLLWFFSQIVEIEDAYIINPERKKEQDKMEGKWKHQNSTLAKKRFRYGYLVLKFAEDAHYLFLRKTFRIKKSTVILEKYNPPKSSKYTNYNTQKNNTKKWVQKKTKRKIKNSQKYKNKKFGSNSRKYSQNHYNHYQYTESTHFDYEQDFERQRREPPQIETEFYYQNFDESQKTQKNRQRAPKSRESFTKSKNGHLFDSVQQRAREEEMRSVRQQSYDAHTQNPLLNSLDLEEPLLRSNGYQGLDNYLKYINSSSFEQNSRRKKYNYQEIALNDQKNQEEDKFQEDWDQIQEQHRDKKDDDLQIWRQMNSVENYVALLQDHPNSLKDSFFVFNSPQNAQYRQRIRRKNQLIKRIRGDKRLRSKMR